VIAKKALLFSSGNECSKKNVKRNSSGLKARWKGETVDLWSGLRALTGGPRNAEQVANALTWVMRKEGITQ
jgi:hypothetical protein